MAKVKIQNIFQILHGAVKYKGFTQATWTKTLGEYVPDFDEGDLYPTGQDQVGIAEGQWPAQGQLQAEDLASMVTLLTASVGDLEVIGIEDGAAAKAKWVIANVLFNSLSIQVRRRTISQSTLGWVCYSADGSTHPVADPVADTLTTAGGTKVKGINVKSVTHTDVPTPGNLDVQIEAARQLTPNNDEGTFYPKGADETGTPEGQTPVQVTVSHEDKTALDALGTTTGSLVVVAAGHGGAADQTITVPNVIFSEGDGQIQRRADGRFTMRGQAHSADGSTFPLSIA